MAEHPTYRRIPDAGQRERTKRRDNGSVVITTEQGASVDEVTRRPGRRR